MPRLVTYRQRRSNGRWLRLYVPVLPVLLVLSPLLLLAVLVACVIYRVSPVGALRGAGQLLWASSGARFEITQGRTAVLVHVI
ncbi:hypothetical protein [Catenuloplanes japonicus]|uniref:hypothetical protein n=1 Tax=Catenuloplanes japonicus TaxID=33876 RepID=UPI0005240454|nr:hypothetical protein [Catenuloplanes japonicus]